MKINNNTGVEVFVVVGIGVSNYTPKSREIFKEVQKVNKNIPNVNPLVNRFNLFFHENNLLGRCLDLEKIPQELIVEIVNEDIVFSAKLSDNEQETLQNSGISIGLSSKDVACMVVPKESLSIGGSEDLWHSVEQSASMLSGVFGGVWNVYKIGSEKEHIVFGYEVKYNEGFLSTEQGRKGVKKRRADSLGLIEKNTMTYSLSEKLREKLSKYYPDLDFSEEMLLSNSSNLKFGHFSSNVTFKISKQLGTTARDEANALSVKLASETDFGDIFSKIEFAPNGFLNFFLRDEFLFESLKEPEAHRVSLPENKNILIESPSANPNKPLHDGHLLNVCLSGSLSAILSEVGFKVHKDNLINDKGLPIAKLIWAFREYAKDSTPEKEGLKPDVFVGKYYVLGAEKFNESKEVESDVRQILRDWEAGEAKIISMWKQLISWALEGQSKTLKRLGEDMGYMWFESEIYAQAKELILSFVDDKKIIKTEDGAVIGQIEKEYGVPDVVLIKSDGTSLYHTQDFYLTTLKVKKFKPWKAIWLVGNEQIAHFQKLFSVIDMLGLIPIDNLYHYAYGFVFDKNGKKMSSRTGEALSGDELIDMIKDAVLNSRDGVDEKTAEVVALGALKYAFLSSDPYKDMKFDIEKAIMFSGKSGPYIMYAYARANNILKKVKNLEKDFSTDIVLTDLDREIILKCLDYFNIIVASANNYSPSILAEYLYDLAKLFNQLYETESVLDAKGDEFVIRVSIVRRVKEILYSGLKMLRIEPLEKM